jgi:lipoprotein-anchoring transpeptidase ErfK/SrfK
MSGSRVRALVVACALLTLVSACSKSEASPEQSPSGTPSAGSSSGTPGAEQPTTPSAKPEPAVVTVKPAKGAEGVRPDQPVTVKTSAGKLRSLSVKDDEGAELAGDFSEDRSQWTSLPQLRPGATYQVKGVATGTDGKDVKISSKFSTLRAERRLKASVVPLAGETVGVAMPIQILWNHPVRTKADKAAVERRLKVETSVPVEGSWRWTGDDQVNWRPKDLWPANTKVTVDVGIQGVRAGDGLWGAASRRVGFRIGHSVVAHVNVTKHVMVVRIDGKVARNIPITAGKTGFTTRSGFKVIMEKYRVKRMDGRTVGINPGDPEYYDIRDVPYAHRVTSSGEFVHGAYWSEGSQGRENVSHGCVGMSVKDAAWYFAQTHRGDPVIVSGTKRGMEPGNGWTDWTMSWDEYKAGSALS